jgi:very-short-patch-repair endonuclease
VRAGLFVEVTPKVVRLTSTPDSFFLRCMTAQLHFAEECFLASTTAARLYGLRSMPERPIRVTIPEHARHRCPNWTDVSRSSWFGPDDHRLTDDGFVVATPLRMLFGLAATIHPFRLARAAEDAWNLELFTPHEAYTYLETHRCRGKYGVINLERWLDGVLGRESPAQSGLEMQLIEALLAIGLPEPARQHPIRLATGETIHLDIAWPAVKLAVEPGHSRWHSGALQQQRDQARDRACIEQGWQIVRFDESLRTDPMAAARQVQRIYRTLLSTNSPRSYRSAT